MARRSSDMVATSSTWKKIWPNTLSTCGSSTTTGRVNCLRCPLRPICCPSAAGGATWMPGPDAATHLDGPDVRKGVVAEGASYPDAKPEDEEEEHDHHVQARLRCVCVCVGGLSLVQWLGGCMLMGSLGW